MQYEYRYIVVVLGAVVEEVGSCTIVVDVQEISDILDLFPNHEKTLGEGKKKLHYTLNF
jgi:hypothetical protein